MNFEQQDQVEQLVNQIITKKQNFLKVITMSIKNLGQYKLKSIFGRQKPRSKKKTFPHQDEMKENFDFVNRPSSQQKNQLLGTQKKDSPKTRFMKKDEDISPTKFFMNRLK